MAALGRFIMDTAKVALNALSPTQNAETLPKFESPSPRQVLRVKNLLFKNFKLPLEIVDVVIDYAEYWPRTTATTAGKTFRVGGSRSDEFIVCVGFFFFFILSCVIGNISLLLKIATYISAGLSSSEERRWTTYHSRGELLYEDQRCT
jgi:hypothetical protein